MNTNNINIDNPYLYSLVKAMQEFLLEEMKGYLHSELRLAKKIEAARTLYPGEREEMSKQYLQEMSGNRG